MITFISTSLKSNFKSNTKMIQIINSKIVKQYNYHDYDNHSNNFIWSKFSFEIKFDLIDIMQKSIISHHYIWLFYISCISIQSYNNFANFVSLYCMSWFAWIIWSIYLAPPSLYMVCENWDEI